MSRDLLAPIGPSSKLRAVEHMPARPDQGRIWLRLLVCACLLAAWALPFLHEWANREQVVVVQEGVAMSASPLVAPGELSAVRAGARWLFTTPIAMIIIGIGLGGAAVLALELALNAGWLAQQRRSLDAAACTYLRIRSLRPQSRKGARTAADPVDLWRGLHSALRQTMRAGGAQRWVAFTLHARPEEPVTLGALIANEPTLARALATALHGQDAETLVDEAVDPFMAALQPGALVCWQELRLTKPAHFSIRTLEEFSRDSLGSLAAALRTPPGVVFTEIQVIVRPRSDADAHTSWRVFALRRLNKLRRKDLLGTTTEAKALEAKLSGETYDVSVRIVAVAQDRAHAREARAAIGELRAAFGQFHTRGGNGRQTFCPVGLLPTHSVSVPAANKCDASSLSRATRRTPRIVPLPSLLLPQHPWAPPMILGSAEVACLWHLPSVELKTLITWLPNRVLPVQPHMFVPPGATDRLIVGHAKRSDGTEAAVGPSLRALRQVLHLTAGMGAGKTRALANFAHQLVPHGFFVLDGKGDDTGGSLAATTLNLVPLADEARLVIVDLLDAEWPVALNPLHGVNPASPGGMTQAIGVILAVFARLDPETWGKSPGMQQYAQMGAALVAETVKHPTLANVKQVIQDEMYRRTLLPLCTNVEVKTFWEETFPQTGEGQKSSRDALLRRFDNLMVDETTRYLITQPVPTVDFLECMEQGRIVVVPLPHRTLGGVAEFISTLLLQSVMRAAFRRPGSDQTRSTVPLIVDELQVFIGKGDSKDIQDAITQLRGFGIAGIYAHQTLAQLGTLRDEMLTNSANRMILRTQEPDASAYAHQFPTTDLTPADISGQLFDEHQYVVFAGGDGPAEVGSIKPLGWPTPLDEDQDIPPYYGPDWKTVLPKPDTVLSPEECEPGAEPLEALVARLVYGETGVHAVSARLAQLPEAEYAYLCARWDTIRAHQRRYILDNPGCIAFDERIVDADPARQALLRRQDRRRRRQQWLSRLETRTPRVLAAANYQRQRWSPTTTEATKTRNS